MVQTNSTSIIVSYLSMMRVLYLLIAIAGVAWSKSAEECDTTTFPANFKFGAGTSAYQIEGAWNEDGKGRSWWDWFMNEYPQLNRNVTGNVACDSYHRYKDDVAAMKEIGLDFYRFSLSWSRILPGGFTNNINQAGVDYYNRLLDELEAARIEPMITLFHGDSPLALEYLGNTWTNPKIVDYFVAYADLAFKLFGDRVKLWVTLNEPRSVCQVMPNAAVPYLLPEAPLGTVEYLCIHHSLLAHAKTYRLYQEKYKSSQNGRVTITLDMNYYIPLTNSTEDAEAAERRAQFEYGIFAHPLVYGDYPEIVKEIVEKNSARQNFSSSRLPKFTKNEKSILKGAYDLFAINSYTAEKATTAPYNNNPSIYNDQQVATSQPEEWPTTASGAKVYPEGIRYVLKYLKENYQNPEIIITENGYSDDTGTLDDASRINFIKETIRQVRIAMCEDGVNVTRYSYWSLLDNLEWNRGYDIKFGLVQVDFNSANLTRTVKNSGYYYKNVIQTKKIDVN